MRWLCESSAASFRETLHVSRFAAYPLMLHCGPRVHAQLRGLIQPMPMGTSEGGKHASMKPELMQDRLCDESLSADCSLQSRVEAGSFNFAGIAFNGATWSLAVNTQIYSRDKRISATAGRTCRVDQPVAKFLSLPRQAPISFAPMALGFGPAISCRSLPQVGH